MGLPLASPAAGLWASGSQSGKTSAALHVSYGPPGRNGCSFSSNDRYTSSSVLYVWNCCSLNPESGRLSGDAFYLKASVP